MSDREADVVILPAVLDRQAASDLTAQLKPCLDGAVRVDASAVEVLTTPCIQVLLAAAKDGRLSVLSPSEEFRSAFDDLALPMPGEVSVATCSLDIAQPERKQPVAVPADQLAMGEVVLPVAARRILTIDDSKTMRDMLRMTLSDAGYDVIQGVDGQDGLDVLGDETVDVVITDINMPRMDGYAVIRELRKKPHLSHTPILVLTTESEADKRQLARDAGATGWMVKPFDPERLVATVRKVLPDADATEGMVP